MARECMAGQRRCPGCGRNQYPLIVSLVGGYADKVRCKYCGEVFRESENPIVPWNKGMLDPNAKCRDPEYARKTAKARYWADPAYYREKAREWAATPRGRAYKREYEQRPDVKARRAAYAKTEKGKEIRRRYSASHRLQRKMTNIRCKAKALSEMVVDASDHRHGTTTGYDYGCRCDRCRAAKRESRTRGPREQ